MNLLIFHNPYEFLIFFYVFQNTIFEKKTVQLLVQLPGKFDLVCNM